ncbi:hypothetical protein [Algicola sagamiensis]|uniref:hypothetical protein n=1 Tax=Algicola sagamiensis TaxID=163869 RepID=UPI000375021B|nr:hypothetical protein [Algicola sagamiensis]
MAREKFAITDDIAVGCFQYLSKKVKTDPSFLSHLSHEETEQAHHAFDAARDVLLYHDQLAELLHAWFYTFLTAKQQTAMKASLRKKRQRSRNDYVSMEIDKDIYWKLSHLAEQEGITIKDYLEQIISDTYAQQRPSVNFSFG